MNDDKEALITRWDYEMNKMLVVLITSFLSFFIILPIALVVGTQIHVSGFLLFLIIPIPIYISMKISDLFKYEWIEKCHFYGENNQWNEIKKCKKCGIPLPTDAREWKNDISQFTCPSCWKIEREELRLQKQKRKEIRRKILGGIK